MSNSKNEAGRNPSPSARALSESITDVIPTKDAHCEVHGTFISKNYMFGRIWTTCPQCVKEADAAQREQDAAIEALRQQKIALRNLERSGIPDRYRDRTLDNYHASHDGQRHALAWAREYAANFAHALEVGRCALFVGEPGTGKNHVSIGIARELLNTGRYRVYFITTLRAIRRIKDTWGQGAKETEAQAIAALVSPDLLILDEVGVQFGSNTELTLLFDVLNDRYERRKPTIFLSNLTLDGVCEYLGDRVFSRIREDGGKYIPFEWADYREHKNNYDWAKYLDEKKKKQGLT